MTGLPSPDPIPSESGGRAEPGGSEQGLRRHSRRRYDAGRLPLLLPDEVCGEKRCRPLEERHPKAAQVERQENCKLRAS